MCIFKLKICIFRLEIYISRLEMQIPAKNQSSFLLARAFSSRLLSGKQQPYAIC